MTQYANSAPSTLFKTYFVSLKIIGTFSCKNEVFWLSHQFDNCPANHTISIPIKVHQIISLKDKEWRLCSPHLSCHKVYEYKYFKCINRLFWDYKGVDPLRAINRLFWDYKGVDPLRAEFAIVKQDKSLNTVGPANYCFHHFTVSKTFLCQARYCVHSCF